VGCDRAHEERGNAVSDLPDSFFEIPCEKEIIREEPESLELRQGKPTPFKWGDLDENGKFLVVRRGVVRGQINLTKSGKVRKVDVSDALMAELPELRRNRKEALLA